MEGWGQILGAAAAPSVQVWGRLGNPVHVWRDLPNQDSARLGAVDLLGKP